MDSCRCAPWLCLYIVPLLQSVTVKGASLEPLMDVAYVAWVLVCWYVDIGFAGILLSPSFPLYNSSWSVDTHMKAVMLYVAKRIFWRNPSILQITLGFLIASGMSSQSGGTHIISVISRDSLRRLRCPLSAGIPRSQLLCSEVSSLPRWRPKDWVLEIT